MQMRYAIILGALLVFAASCAQQPVIEEKDGNTLTVFANNYYRFDKNHFEGSLSEGKIIFLDFHANWCPICALEKPKILNAFNELDNDNVVGYQVHFNDGSTNDDDEEMAKKYGITYQHTKVIIDKSGEVAFKTLEVLSKEEIIENINQVG